MESNSLKDLFENKYGMKFQEALELIKSYFNKQLPFFTVVEEYNEPTGHWGIKYSYQNTIVFISCSRGYLENEIAINGKEFSLLQFDQRMENVEIASKKNILFTLDVIKRLLEITI